MTQILRSAAGIVGTVWIMHSMILAFTKGRIDPDHPYIRGVRIVWSELRPFYLPSAVIVIGLDVMSGDIVTWWVAVADACSLLNWFLFKDVDDDDRWKRRKAKFVEKIERRGARLVAVPVGGGS